MLPPPIQILDLVKNMVSFVPSKAAKQLNLQYSTGLARQKHGQTLRRR
jgi:hypothetical protein